MRARDQTLLHYPVETFNKIVTSGQFQRLKPSGVAGPPILCATHRRHVLEMSVLGYAVCAAVITACEDDPSPKLLQLTDLTDLSQHAVCNKIGNMKTKPVIATGPCTSHDRWRTRPARTALRPRLSGGL